MRKGRVRQASDIDHVGAGRAHRAGAVEDVLDPHGRGIDDLCEDADVIAREVETATSLAEVRGQVFQLLRSALERNAEFSAQACEVGAAAPGHDDARRIHRTRYAARDDW